MLIIDSHAHLVEDAGVPALDATLETTMKHLDDIGCDYIVQVFGKSIGGFVDWDEAKKSIEIYEKTNGRVLNYFYYNPKQAEICLEIIEKYHDHPAFVGIKIHPSDNSIYADDEGYRAVFEIAKKYDLPIMSHTWALTSNPKQKFAVPERFEKFIKDFPEVKFIMGHSGGRTQGIKEAVRIGKLYPNTYFDIAGDIYNRKLVEYICENVGADKLLIGSDILWFDLSVPIGMVMGANISSEDKALIVGGNAARIFKIKK
ncbi:MAG: amidohydrolase family protein [Clostridia bacterium]|nr:amidohydrolase family protein [Clostridia bacterium]